MPTPQKQQIIEETQGGITDVRGLYLADFSGLTVEKFTLLRAKCRAEGIRFKVVKNTLLKRAFHAHGITALDDLLVGNTGLVYSPTSETSPARILADFAKEHERPKIKGAVVDGRVFDGKAVQRLASLPSREVLLSQLLATFVAPMSQFLAAVNAAVSIPVNMADALHRERSKAS